MQNKVNPNNFCRLCSDSHLKEVFDFGEVPLGNNLQHSSIDALHVDQFRLNVMRCQECGHFQLGYSVAKELMYATNYTYLSGIGKAFLKHIQEYVGWTKKICNLHDNALVLDVGSNDGTCLSVFKEQGFNVLGIDPAELPASIANKNGIPTINDFFNSKTADKLVEDYGYLDLVTSQNVLAHVEDLRETFENVYKILKPNGYFVFEVGYFYEVLKSKCFDTIYHEHIDYHHAAPLASYLSSLGFDVLNLSVNNIQGGSLRVLLKKTGLGSISHEAKKFIIEEKKSILYDPFFLGNWIRNIQSSMENLKDSVAGYQNKGFKIIGYGAPTKATLLLNLSGLSTNVISFICEDNEFKIGRYLPKTSIMIRPTSDLETFLMEHKSVILILAWNFADDIIERLKVKVKSPTSLIIPLPNLRFITI
jgi:2-polyprenyl-3-methyl-5-hydroxy-6-metoxy-1,4-benzoquinol methylase